MMTSRRIGWLARGALLMLALVGATFWLLAADPALPPRPSFYFNDGAHVVDAATASDLNEQLAQFERDTSNQIVVAIYPSLPEGQEIAQYATQTYNSWISDKKGPVGQIRGGSRGAILFVFVNDHKLYIVTGRDLEGALPDITCKEIIDQQIVPAFKRGDYAGGIHAGVAAMMSATKGEYKGTGQTSLERNQPQTDNTPVSQNDISGWVIFAVIAFIILSRVFFPALGAGAPFIFSGGGYGRGYGGGWGGGGFGGGGGGGGFGGGGGGSSGFGGFSGGGGGGSAGGGAGGSW